MGSALCVFVCKCKVWCILCVLFCKTRGAVCVPLSDYWFVCKLSGFKPDEEQFISECKMRNAFCVPLHKWFVPLPV